jgi:chemotaxis protein methyltransferase CheR
VKGALDPASLERFRALVLDRMGLEFPDDKLEDLTEALTARLHATGLPWEAYLQRLSTPGTAPDELRDVARHLTVNETYFFRNPLQFRALTEVVFPARLANRPRQGLGVLSAGCASGEEIYTVAMLLREREAAFAHLPPPTLRGIDLNTTVLEKARRGRYTEWSLRATPPGARQRWFRSEGRELVLSDEIRNMVTFDVSNLAQDPTGLAAPGSLDVIFCRNVFIYFSPEAIRAAVAGFARALQPGGYLFLGDAETLRGVSTEFELCHTHDTFYYRLRGERDRVVPAFTPTYRPPPAPEPEPEPEPVPDSGWIDAIGQASRRVASLRHGSPRARPAAPAPAPPPRAPAGRWDLAPIRRLMEADQEAQALAAIAGLPREAQGDPEVKLLQAALLTNRGDLAGAERTCQELLALDGFNAGAHYLLALGCEQRAALADALEHDRIAAYLDPDFAMPRLHFGRLARRTGDLERARRELARALELLAGEDPARLSLFGGGFSREGLRQICRNELAACGGGR